MYAMKKLSVALVSLSMAFATHGQPAKADEVQSTEPHMIQDMTCLFSWRQQGYANNEHCFHEVSPEIFRVICEDAPSEEELLTKFRSCFLGGQMARVRGNSAGQYRLTA